jgi:hypothetical protein
MKQIRSRLSYANVMSSLAVFLVLGGATAIAAKQLGKNTVGTKALKKNSVTKAKIKKNAIVTAKIKNAAVTTAKLKDGAVTGAKVADGSLSGADIDGNGTSFSQLVAELRSTSQVPLTGGQLYPLNGTYTQPAGRTDQYFGAIDVNFSASCKAPRSAAAYLLLDAPKPTAPTVSDLVGVGQVLDEKGSGSVTRRAEFSPFPGGTNPMSRLAPAADTQHTFTILMLVANCSSGSGVTITGAGIDVIGTR